MAAAVARRTATAETLGSSERVSPADALALYLGATDAPGGPPRRVEVGAPADLCLLKIPLAEALVAPSAELVRTTLIGGWMREPTAP
jgi:hypothetical protein